MRNSAVIFTGKLVHDNIWAGIYATSINLMGLAFWWFVRACGFELPGLARYGKEMIFLSIYGSRFLNTIFSVFLQFTSWVLVSNRYELDDSMTNEEGLLNRALSVIGTGVNVGILSNPGKILTPLILLAVPGNKSDFLDDIPNVPFTTRLAIYFVGIIGLISLKSFTEYLGLSISARNISLLEDLCFKKTGQYVIQPPGSPSGDQDSPRPSYSKYDANIITYNTPGQIATDGTPEAYKLAPIDKIRLRTLNYVASVTETLSDALSNTPLSGPTNKLKEKFALRRIDAEEDVRNQQSLGSTARKRTSTNRLAPSSRPSSSGSTQNPVHNETDIEATQNSSSAAFFKQANRASTRLQQGLTLSEQAEGRGKAPPPSPEHK